MKYNLLGHTGLKVSALCLGTMTSGGKGWAEANLERLNTDYIDLH